MPSGKTVSPANQALLEGPTAGFSAAPVTLSGTQTVARLTVKCDLIATKEPVTLSVLGAAKIGEQVLPRGCARRGSDAAFLVAALGPG